MPRAKSPASAAFLWRIISPSAGLWSRDTTRRKLKKMCNAFAILDAAAVCVSLLCFLYNAICKSPDRWRRQATAHLKFSSRLEEIDYEYKGIATQGGKLKGKRTGRKAQLLIQRVRDKSFISNNFL